MAMQRQNIEKVVERIVRTIRPDIDFELEKKLISDGLLESMDVVEIVVQMEEQLRINIPTHELVESNLNSLSNMVDMCVRIIGENEND